MKTNFASIKVKQTENKYVQPYLFFSLISTKMSLFSKLALSLLISLFLAKQFFVTEGSLFQNPEIIVKITNALKVKNELIVHCKSSNDDLGVHKLTPWISYDFSFRPNFWGTTLFYCSFEWPGSFHYFNIYIDKRDRKNCDNILCSWYVSEQDVCMFNYKTNDNDICYKW